MKEPIAFCGMDCANCPTYLATQNDDDNIRKEIQKLWKDGFNTDVPLEAINCDGCKEDGKKGPFCTQCQVKTCADGKNLANCGLCDEYACEQLTGLLNMLPPNINPKERLDEINKNK